MDLQNTLEPKYEGFSFGVDHKRLAASLHQFADDISAGRVAIQQTRLIQRACIDDFYSQSLIIRFAERVSQQPLPQPIDG